MVEPSRTVHGGGPQPALLHERGAPFPSTAGSYRISRRGLAALAAGTASASAAQPLRARAAPVATPAGAPVRVVLPNGLVVVAEERRTSDVVALQVTARAGTRDTAEHPGLSAITSRVMFQGTPRRPSETELLRAATRVGGSLGRSTGQETSSFGSVMPAEEVDLGLDLLADILREPLFAADALARQQQITLQDLSQRQADPASHLADLFTEKMFAGHPLGLPPIGTRDSIQAATREALVGYYQRSWNPANVVLTIVGRISPDDALARSARVFGDLLAGEPVERPPVPARVRAGTEAAQAAVGQQQVQFRLGFPGPSVRDPERYALSVLSGMMSGRSGRLQRELRTARSLVYATGPGSALFSDAGAWYVTANVDPQNLPATLDLMLDGLRRLRAEPPPQEEVADAISRIAGSQILADEANASRGSRHASREILGIEPTEEFVRRIRQVTPEAVLGVAQKYLDLDRALLVAVGPAGLSLPALPGAPAASPAAPVVPAPPGAAGAAPHSAAPTAQQPVPLAPLVPWRGK